MSDQTPDIGALLQQAQALQEQLARAQETAAEQLVVGQSGGGVVKVTVTGGMDFRSVQIDPSTLDDVSMLEDLILAALHDAVGKVNELNREAMSGLGELFGDDTDEEE